MNEGKNRARVWLLLAQWMATGLILSFFAGAATLDGLFGSPGRSSWNLPGDTMAIVLYIALLVGWPISIWPLVVRAIPWSERSWLGFVIAVAIWTPFSAFFAVVVTFWLFVRDGSGHYAGAGIIVVPAFILGLVLCPVFFVLPRVLIPWLRPGAILGSQREI